jgi:hypothetical protein
MRTLIFVALIGLVYSAISAALAQPTIISVATVDGRIIKVKDFKHDPDTLPTVSNPGKYDLAGGWARDPDVGKEMANIKKAGNAPYMIQYDDRDQSFKVLLNKEPIARVRLQAEQYLMGKLGISQADMCRLRRDVGTVYNVNQVFSGKNLDFSFCPGAVALK